ncbi:ADP-heptose--LPS heptosyltransferase [Achromobacter piechaudii]|uniref:glycosyltransferase family 9 protein n=1 Tax=Achromobacter piechaudii TaxID=72556 RepID=UPI0006812FCA|nr:glycosyltransferase family 9 protein [Achromobacter piechaudii]KNY09262.1 ADP-heptose--LPS heptosyltransferase [Achromobacter piechaudii]
MSDIVVFLRSRRKFGDQIVAYPALSLLKQFWGDKRVRVVSRYAVGRFYNHLPWVDEFVQADTFPAQVRALPPRAHASLSLHHSSERYSLISLFRRPALRIGFDNDRLCDRVWTHSHRKDINEYIGLANLRLLATYQDHEPERTARNAFLEIASPHVARVKPADVILMPGGGSGAFKRWSLERYLVLADLLKKQFGGSASFTFVLGPDEGAMRQRLDRLGRNDFNVEFCRPAAELAALMHNARLVVSNDCGPSHIAQGLCVPYVGVFNEPNPEWFWARRYTRDVVPDNGTADINSIEPARVFNACLDVLAEPRFS